MVSQNGRVLEMGRGGVHSIDPRSEDNNLLFGSGNVAYPVGDEDHLCLGFDNSAFEESAEILSKFGLIH